MLNILFNVINYGGNGNARLCLKFVQDQLDVLGFVATLLEHGERPRILANSCGTTTKQTTFSFVLKDN